MLWTATPVNRDRRNHGLLAGAIIGTLTTATPINKDRCNHYHRLPAELAGSITPRRQSIKIAATTCREVGDDTADRPDRDASQQRSPQLPVVRSTVLETLDTATPINKDRRNHGRLLPALRRKVWRLRSRAPQLLWACR